MTLKQNILSVDQECYELLHESYNVSIDFDLNALKYIAKGKHIKVNRQKYLLEIVLTGSFFYLMVIFIDEWPNKGHQRNALILT